MTSVFAEMGYSCEIRLRCSRPLSEYAAAPPLNDGMTSKYTFYEEKQ